ncbi:hypothetical protein AHAS_Ahas19G0246500 [Arachis hypogaea]
MIYFRKNEIEKTPVIKRKQPERVAKIPTQLDKDKRALEIIREKRSKKRNDGAQSANIAPDQFDIPKAQNEFSQTVLTVNLDSEQLLQTQGSSTPSVNAASNTKPPLALSLASSVQEQLMKDDFIYVPQQNETQQTSNNDCPQEAEKQGVTVSLTSSVIEDLFKDDYVYEQQAQELPVQQQSEQETPVNVRPLEQQQQHCEEPTAQQSKQEAPVDVYPPEPKKQGVMGSLTSSVIEEFFKDADVYQVFDEEQSQEPPVARQSEKETLILSSFDSAAQPRERKDERPSFSLGISPPASQPTQPSQESVSQLEILAEAVVDAGVTAALKFAEATSSEPNLPAAKVVSIHSMILNQIKVRWYQEQMYIVPLDIVLFVPICNGGHWWLWIDDVNKKKFYVLDPINKLLENIPDSRKQLNKFVVRFNNFLDKGVRWGETLNGGWTGRGSRVYPIEWSTYKVRIFLFYSAIFNVFHSVYY